MLDEKIKQLAVHERFRELMCNTERKLHEVVEDVDQISEIACNVLELPKLAAVEISVFSVLDTLLHKLANKYGWDVAAFLVKKWLMERSDPVYAAMRMLFLPKVFEILDEARREYGDD